MDGLELKYDVTGAEARKGLWLQFVARRLRRTVLYTVILALLFGAELAAVIFHPENDFDKLMMMLSGTLLILIWLLPALARRRTARVMEGIDTDFTMTVYPDRIVIPRESGEYILRFADTPLSVTETPELFLIDPADGQLFLLPKRRLGEDAAALSELFKKGLEARYRKQGK